MVLTVIRCGGRGGQQKLTEQQERDAATHLAGLELCSLLGPGAMGREGVPLKATGEDERLLARPADDPGAIGRRLGVEMSSRLLRVR